MGYYRTWMSVSLLIGVNLAVRIFNIPVDGDLILGNHLVESLAALSIVVFLSDLRIISNGDNKNYLKIGLIAFFAGIVMVLASFSSLFVPSAFFPIVSSWFRIAPITIGIIGIPSLYFADKLAQKNKILGFENVGKRGLINIVIIGVAFSIFMIYMLNKYNLLII